MNLLNALLGSASELEPAELQRQLEPILAVNETVLCGFKTVRDLFVFTHVRLIFIDKQGITGKKVSYHSIPYRNITQFAVETAGHFDMDAELKIWVSSGGAPIDRRLRRGTDVTRVQKLLAQCIMPQVDAKTGH
jgi:hypothetical protein